MLCQRWKMTTGMGGGEIKIQWIMEYATLEKVILVTDSTSCLNAIQSGC